MAFMNDFYLPAGTNLSDFFEDTGFEFVSKKEPYLANNLYIKIENMTTTSTRCSMLVSFRKEKFSKVLMTKEYQFDINLESDGSNIFEQGYEYLNTFPEFKGSITV